MAPLGVSLPPVSIVKMAEGLDWFRTVVLVLYRAVRNDLAQIGFGFFPADRNPPKLTK
jgi:hypothetical protein